MLKFSTDLYKAAIPAVSDEATRYYLCGVFVEPAAGGGVTLTATNGHVLVHIWDAGGQADESAIVDLPKWIIDRDKFDKKKLLVDDAANGYHVNNGENRIDGTFPDYRRVVPAIDTKKSATATYNAKYLSALATVGAAIAKWNNRASKTFPASLAMTVYSDDANGPAIIRWEGVDNAFAVLMPMRGPKPETLPRWFPVKEDAAKDAA